MSAPAPRPSLAALAATLRAGPGVVAKRDIATATHRLGLRGSGAVPVGDDCAALPDPDGSGHTLLAIEGFLNAFVARDPWFAGWCGVMVNLSDIAAMGGRPTAIVDALWAAGGEQAAEILAGMRAAAERYGVPIVGGHTNLSTDRPQLSVAVVGRAGPLLTSFDARPGDRLVAAIDLRGRYRAPYANWEAATDAPAERLRGDLALLPLIAERGLARAAKDISQAGLAGTAAMLAECSGVAITLDLPRIPMPAGVAADRWLQSFPSFGFLLAVPAAHVDSVCALFTERAIAAAAIGTITEGSTVSLTDGTETAVLWDLADAPLLGLGPRDGARQEAAQ